MPRTATRVKRPKPIITLTTDFGLTDFYVAVMKAVLLRYCPDATLIDITHNIPRHDILCGSIALERAIDGFPADTVHLAVVDPGVGTARRLLIAEVNGSIVVCPDNGLITWAWRLHNGGRASELTWRPRTFSSTFHGRDIMAPVAGMIASGKSPRDLGQPMHDVVLLDVAPAQGLRGQVIHIDHFGNVTTNIQEQTIKSLSTKSPKAVHIRNRSIGPLGKTYGDVPPGKPLALIGSSGLLEVAVRDGSAAAVLKIRVGDAVSVG